MTFNSPTLFRVTNRRIALIPALALAVVFAAGCKDSESAPVKPKASKELNSRDDSAALKSFVAQNSQSPGDSNSSSALPPGHPPVPGMATPPKANNNGLPAGHPPLPNGARLDISGPAAMPGERIPLKYKVPDSWTEQTPSMNMRKAQYQIPGAEGGDSNGEMVLYYFGPQQGGSVDANIARWVGQFTTEDGQPIPDSARVVETTEVNGMKVTTLDIAGKYNSSMMGGPAPSGTQRMLAAVVETPAGPWFFKGTGPVDTMAKNKPAFDALIQSLSWKEDDGTGGA